ncbi:hypothetical protein [Streptomyces sp. NPDC051219]|uniref:hypothetical protein n=1 Tax=Streptomyces sp. NPDC051219 TaxID=3155283 RepID=UPI003448CFF8
METGLPQASIASAVFDGVVREVLEAVIGFLPDWLEIPLLSLIILAVFLGWARKLRRNRAERRAARSARPVAAAQNDQGRGADHLGPYAPQPARQAQREEPSGADFLGAYAPQQRRGGDSG